MAEMNFTPPPGGSGQWIDLIWSIAATKVAPALAGSYVRGLFPPRKAIGQRLAESLGGVLMVIYAGKPAAAILWAALDKAMITGGLGRARDVMERAEAGLLAAFLVGLLGMTIVEGGIVWVRTWMRRRAEAA